MLSQIKPLFNAVVEEINLSNKDWELHITMDMSNNNWRKFRIIRLEDGISYSFIETGSNTKHFIAKNCILVISNILDLTKDRLDKSITDVQILRIIQKCIQKSGPDEKVFTLGDNCTLAFYFKRFSWR